MTQYYIKDAILGVLNALRDIEYTPTDYREQCRTGYLFQEVDIFNSQVKFEANGQTFATPRPAAFVEMHVGDYTQLAFGGNIGSNCQFIIHLVDDQYDSKDGNFDRNLDVFDYRQLLVDKLSNYTPPQCSVLTLTNEKQDYEHGNVYHYLLTFTCSFVDMTGSILASDNTNIKQPPTDLNLTTGYGS